MPADGNEPLVAMHREHDVIGLEHARRDARDHLRQLVGIEHGVDVREKIEQHAQSVSLDERSADELDEIVDGAIDVRDRLASLRHRRRAADAQALDVSGEIGLARVVDRQLELREAAIARLGGQGQRAQERTARALERFDPRDGTLGHDAIEDAPTEIAEAGTNGEAVAPRRGGPEHRLRTTEPHRRFAVARVRRVRGQELGEANDRARLVALEPRGLEHLSGASHARATLLELSGVGRIEPGLELVERGESRRLQRRDEIACAREQRARRRPVARVACEGCALERELRGELTALFDMVDRRVECVGIERERRKAPTLRARDAHVDEPRAGGERGRNGTETLDRRRHQGHRARVFVPHLRGGRERELYARDADRIARTSRIAPGIDEHRVALFVAGAGEEHRRQADGECGTRLGRRRRKRGSRGADPPFAPHVSRRFAGHGAPRRTGVDHYG